MVTSSNREVLDTPTQPPSGKCGGPGGCRAWRRPGPQPSGRIGPLEISSSSSPWPRTMYSRCEPARPPMCHHLLFAPFGRRFTGIDRRRFSLDTGDVSLTLIANTFSSLPGNRGASRQRIVSARMNGCLCRWFVLSDSPLAPMELLGRAFASWLLSRTGLPKAVSTPLISSLSKAPPRPLLRWTFVADSCSLGSTS